MTTAQKTAHGPFEVKASPLPADENCQSVGVMRMAFEKRFTGALEANSVVSMIGMMDQELGSGGYVALERLTGRLDGREGTFCLQHSCTMDRGKPTQNIVIVPDSGTGALQGISGAMIIDIKDNGDHFYSLEYTIA